MPDQIHDEAAALLAPMLKKTLFVAISRAVATADRQNRYAADSLWPNRQLVDVGGIIE